MPLVIKNIGKSDLKKANQLISVNNVRCFKDKKQRTLRNLKENRKGFDQRAFLPCLWGKRDQENDMVSSLQCCLALP